VYSSSRSPFYYQLSLRFAPAAPAVVSVKASVIATASSSSTADEEDGDFSTAAAIAASFAKPSAVKPAAVAVVQVQNKRKPFAFGTLARRTQRLMTLTDPAYIPGSDPEAERGKVKITRRTFNNLIDNWAFSGHADLIQQIEALVQRMEDMFERNVQADDDDEDDDEDNNSKNDSSKPATTANIRPCKIQPDARTYTKAIYALAKSGAPDAGERAQAIWIRMNHLYESGANILAKPNAFAFAGVLQAMSDDPNQAQQLLQQLLEKYEDTNDKDFLPTDRFFD
jgi:hypothetical protein